MIARAKFFLAALGAGLLALHLLYWLPIQPGRTGPMDSNVYHHAAEELAAGRPVYGTHPRARLDEPPYEFLYPPTALLFLRPFAAVSRAAFQGCFYAFAIAAFWVLAAALTKMVSGRLKILDVFVAGALLHLVPGTIKMLALGNMDVFVLALVAWALAAPRAAGILLTFAAALKLYPGLLVLALCWRMPARFARQVVFTGSALVALTLFAFGSDVFLAWKNVAVPALTAGVFSEGNVSLTSMIARPFVDDMAGPLPSAVRLIFTVFPYAAVIAAVFIACRFSPRRYGAVVLVAAAWVAPICWWWRLTSVLAIAVAAWVQNEARCVKRDSNGVRCEKIGDHDVCACPEALAAWGK